MRPAKRILLLLALAAPGWSQLYPPTQRMTADVGIFRDGFLWMLNAAGNGQFVQGTDHVTAYGGLAGDYPIAGNWSGASWGQGCFNIGIYRSSSQTFILDTNGDLLMGPGDQSFVLSIAQSTDIPVTGDWSGNGKTKVGLYRPSTCEWFLDYDGDGVWNPAVDVHYQSSGYCSAATPVTGDWTGTGTTKVGFYSYGRWTLDTAGDGSFATTYSYGIYPSSDIPVVGNWYGGAIADLGVFNQRFLWYLDSNNNHQYDQGTDILVAYGSGTTSDVPIVGNWTQNVAPANANPSSFNVVVNGTSRGSTATIPSAAYNLQLELNFFDPVNGSGDIAQGEVYLTDANSTRQCDYLWSRPNTLTPVTTTSNESFCTITSSSITNNPGNLGEATLTLSANFGSAPPGTYTVYSSVQDGQGLTSPTGQIGTITISPGYSALNLADNGTFVTAVYLAVLGQDPDQPGWLLWVNALNLGTTTRDAMINSFLTTAGYQLNPPTDTTFLTNLYQNALNRPPDSAGLNGYLSLLASGQTRSQVVAAFINLAEFATVQSNRIPNDTSAMPPDTPPIALGYVNTTVGYRELQTGYSQYAEVTINDPNGARFIGSGFVWFVTTDGNGNVTQQCPVYFSISGSTVQVETTGQSSSNIVCSVSSGSVAYLDYFDYTVGFFVTFSSPGNFSILANATDTDGLTSPWSDLGTWGLYTPNTQPPPYFTLSGPTTPVSLVAVSPNGGPVVPINVTVAPYNTFTSTVTFFPDTPDFVVTGSGGPGTVRVNLQAEAGGPTSLLLQGSGGNASAYLAVPVSIASLQSTVTQTISSTPSNVPIVVDYYGTCNTPCTFQWNPGDMHNLSAPSSTTQSGTTYNYTGWSDSGTESHQVTVGSSARTYTANYIGPPAPPPTITLLQTSQSVAPQGVAVFPVYIGQGNSAASAAVSVIWQGNTQPVTTIYPSTITGSGWATVIISAPNLATLTTYNFTITTTPAPAVGAAGSLTVNPSITLQPGFTLSTPTPSIALPYNVPTQLQVLIGSVGGYANTVTFSSPTAGVSVSGSSAPGSTYVTVKLTAQNAPNVFVVSAKDVYGNEQSVNVNCQWGGSSNQPAEAQLQYVSSADVGIGQGATFTYVLSPAGYYTTSYSISGCTVSGTGVTATVTNLPASGTGYFGTFQISFVASGTASPGLQTVYCTWGNLAYSIPVIAGIMVYSTGCTPSISSTQVNGQNTNTVFAGSSGSIAIAGSCLNQVDEINGDPYLAISYYPGPTGFGPRPTPTSITVYYTAQACAGQPPCTATGSHSLNVLAQNAPVPSPTQFVTQLTLESLDYGGIGFIP